MYCAISGEVPSEPVVSTKSGFVFEKRIIQKHMKEVGDGKCPISGIAMSEEDLIAVKGNKIVRPRPLIATSIPGMLSVFQNEWDEVMLETFTLKSQLDATRQELSHSLYQHDAACRVIARLMRERDEAQTLVTSLQALGYTQGQIKHNSNVDIGVSGRTGSDSDTITSGSGPMDSGIGASAAVGGQEIETGDAAMLDTVVVEGITNKFNELSAARKARKKAGGYGECVATRISIGTYAAQQTITPHKADSKTGVTCMAVCDAYNSSGSNNSSDNGIVVLTGASDKTVALTDCSSGRVLARLTGHTKKVSAVAFHPDRACGHLFSASADKTIKMWQPSAQVPAKGRGKAATATTLNFEVAFSWCSHSSSSPEAVDYGEVVGMAVHPYGGAMLCASQNQAWHIVDTLEGRTLVSKASNSSSDRDVSEMYTCCGLHPDGLILGVGTSAATLQVWDIRQQTNVAMLMDETARGGAVRDLCFSENGYNVASGTEEGTVKIWDLRKLSCSTTIKLGEQAVSSVCYDPSSAFLAAGGAGVAGGDIHVLVAKEWTSVLTLPAVHNKVVTAVRWAADSGSIYSSAMDRTVKIFRTSA